MNPYQFDITSDDQPFYQIDINYMPESYKQMLDGVLQMLKKNFKRRFRIVRTLFWFSFLFLLATNIRFIVGDPMFFHKIIPGYNAMLPPVVLTFFITGLIPPILQIAFWRELAKIKSPLKKGLVKAGQTTRYAFY